MIYYCDYIYTGVFAILGASFGFFAFRHSIIMNKQMMFKQWFLSVGLGLFLAFTTTEYLHTMEQLPKKLSMLLGSLVALGLPDFVLRYYPRFISKVATKVIDVASEKSVGVAEEFLVKKRIRTRSKDKESQ